MAKRFANHSGQSRMTAFFHRHDRLLTSIGAIVVVLTFVAKEGIRDFLKNNKDSIEFARNEYVARSDTRAVLNEVGGTYIVLSDLMEELTHHPPGFEKGDPDGPVVSQFNFYKNQLEGIQRVLETARALLQALPKSAKEIADADAIAKQIEELRQKMDAEETDLQSDAVPGNARQTDLPPEVKKKLSETTLGLALNNSELLDHIERLASKARTMATAQDEEYNRWYYWSTVGSWVLYGLGVTLSLLTAIYGAPGDHAKATVRGE